ncbi:tetratricopeptide repeat protein [Dyella mobilis]|uniref:Tetratricopeptide repeat protein n=1 Tax=Dyella mobilis TaxID=1849582 RepID=A0ABS2KC92_9GAMM|nr:tetratricopeptide repeat protein [Dyella mobilis]MBM7128425.1 tetratricopeptide repeat protein [Dyella mobilis]GLQ99730.1 hypothetical protein GCM10007863_41500 [Dyella mobilis]
MDSDQEGLGLSKPSESQGKIKLALAGILGFVAVVLVLHLWWDGRNADQAAQQERKGEADYRAFLAAVKTADGIADPLQRCLQTPDLPGSHWNETTTRAYCRLHAIKALSLADIENLLKQGKAAEVDHAFQSYLDAQLHDPDQPGVVDAAFDDAGFNDSNAHTRSVIELWKQQEPQSAFALAASGMQYFDAAQQARGFGWARDLNDDQIQGMDQQLVLARRDLDQAVSLMPTLVAAYSSMISAGALDSDGDYMYQAAASGLKQDPANFAIRRQMMSNAQDKWGDMFGGLLEQVHEDQSLVGRNPLLRMVVQTPAVYRATCYCNYPQSRINELVVQAADKNLSASGLISLASKVDGPNNREAVELYSEALRFNPTNVDALRWRSQDMIALGDSKGAIAAFAAVAKRFPENNAMQAQLGNIYAQAGDVKDSEATLLAVLQRDPDNYDALGLLGDLYNHAGRQPQKAEVMADTLISKYPDKAAGYIVRSCNQMDHNLPGVYDTIHYFIDHFGDDPQWKSQTAEMRGYLLKHPEKV